MVSFTDLGFNARDAVRIREHLRALRPHLADGEFGVVGGLAVRYHAWKAGRLVPRRPFNDVDMVIRRTATVRPVVSRDFMIAHHHPEEQGLYFALVDRHTATKVDCFAWDNPHRQFEEVNIEGMKLPISSAEDQLAVTVRDLQKVGRGQVIDPKQLDDAQLLLSITDPIKAEKSWRQAPFSDGRLVEAFLHSLAQTQRHPERLVAKLPGRQRSERCGQCTKDPRYPLTPLREVYAAFGSVR